jgi:hypothetical protein
MIKFLELRMLQNLHDNTIRIAYNTYDTEESFFMRMRSSASSGFADPAPHINPDDSDRLQAEKVCEMIRAFSRLKCNKVLIWTLQDGYTVYESRALRVYQLVARILADESSDSYDSVAYDFFLKYPF